MVDLSPRESEVIEFREKHQLTYKRIGELFFVGKERARQIYQEAKRKQAESLISQSSALDE